MPERVPSEAPGRAATGAAAAVVLFLIWSVSLRIPAWAQGLAVVDSLRRPVAIPARVDRILSLQPEITRILVALGAGGRLVGLDYFIRDDDYIFPIVFPEGAGLPVVSKPDESVNRELVVRLRPDVIFASPTERQVPESIQRTLGIPVVALASMGRFDRLLEEIALLGRITGRQARAAELAACFREKIDGIEAALGPLAEAARPRVYLSFWSSLLRTPVAYEPVDRAGGKNVADGLLPSYLGTIGAVVNLERIIRWDPDVFLIQGSFLPKNRRVTVEGVLGDGRLQSIRAVRDGRVLYTFGFWYWWDPACVIVETLYLATVFHPEKFAGADIEAEGNAVFREFYGKEGVFTRLAGILDYHDWKRE